LNRAELCWIVLNAECWMLNSFGSC
jgi:hypothetical protein